MPRRVRTALLAAVASGLAQVGVAAPLPGPMIPDGFGVQVHTHASIPTVHLQGVADAGFKVVRTNLYWPHTEREQRVYDWSALDPLFAEMKRLGLRPLIILGFSNGLYEPRVTVTSVLTKTPVERNGAPSSQATIEAFARWAAAAAEHFKAYDVMWEIWNEPDYYYFWAPKPDPRMYAALAEHACKAIRKVDPDAVVMGPGSAHVPTGYPEKEAWWRLAVSPGLADCLTAVSVHPYADGEPPPEWMLTGWQRFGQFLKTQLGTSVPTVSSEMGFSTYQRKRTVSERDQGAYIVRYYLINLLSKVPVTIYYDWRNDGTDPREKEHNFGMVHKDLSPRPAVAIVRRFIDETRGYSVDKRLRDYDPDVFVLRLSDSSGGYKLALWTTGKERTVQLPRDWTQATAVRLDGGDVETVAGKVRIDGMPVIVSAVALSGVK